jgi:hypothetical protein
MATGKQLDEIARLLKIVVDAYNASIDPGHSDLYDEQPHRIEVRATLGDFRKMEQMLWRLK